MDSKAVSVQIVVWVVLHGAKPRGPYGIVVSKMALGQVLLIFSYLISLHLIQCMAAKCNTISHFESSYLSSFAKLWDKNTVKPLFIVFVGGLKKKQWIRENSRCRSHS
jgi:hypothetical protein